MNMPTEKKVFNPDWYTYYNCPLFMIRKVWHDTSEGIRDIQCYGAQHILTTHDTDLDTVCECLDIAPPFDEDEMTSRYANIERRVRDHKFLHGNLKLSGIQNHVLKSFADNLEDIELLAAHVAIRSQIGRKEYVGTNKKAIVMRMIGAQSNKELDDTLKTDYMLSDIYEKYMKRYHFERLILRLLDKKLLKGKETRKNGLCKSTMHLSMRLNQEQLKAKLDEAWEANDPNKQEPAASKANDTTKETFITYMSLYEGIKGNDYDYLYKRFVNACKRLNSPLQVEVEKIPTAIQAYKASVENLRANGFKELNYKNASTWINNQCWREDYTSTPKKVVRFEDI